jgi:superfamily II DNA or RNA helicase
MTQTNLALLSDFLSQLETQETRLLSWGVVDGSFTRDEIIDTATQFLSVSDIDPEDLLEDMIEHRLLFEVEGGRRYRTRMAETVRLLVRLRQMFPGRPWQSSPTLVSDYRFTVKPRRYPNRNQSVESVLSEVQASVQLDLAKRLALERMLRPGNATLHLSEFQVRATRQILHDLKGNSSRGIIVSTGTGTGKTLAFYLPVLTFLAGTIRPGQFATKVLALYPRKELLKDQITETLRQTRALHLASIDSIGRKITIGAFYGDTPYRSSEALLAEHSAWNEQSAGFICPYFRCPFVGCEGELIWHRSDIASQIERLVCTVRHEHVVDESEIILTRRRLSDSPPDILFTTSEMLNREMTNSNTRHVFGLGARTSPRVILLDEVHTYQGTTGAQVALLLRRWRQAIGRGTPVEFVGLSATLRNASEFFATLVGLNLGQVVEISPGNTLIERSAEYQIALRGDPVSGTSLLATTIQSSMLLRRMLDNRQSNRSEGLYGSTMYDFTDNLDVTNRLYNDLQDAEGVDFRGNRLPNRRPLAELRASSMPGNAQRMIYGQSWRSPEEIGHDLSDSLRITRTSSQDAGVNRESDVVVATASLEVGFNDPTVGAILQHKAPIDAAQFLQRRGRAGRRPQMRPWTVVVLSDYGRDRLAYQGYDLLFDPELPPRYLPIRNRYVLRMHALFVYMEWLGREMAKASVPSGSVYFDWSGPTERQDVLRRQQWTADFIRNFLTSEPVSPRRLAFEQYLEQALQVSNEEVKALLWETPRSLMRSALPTLLRRLESGWKRWRTKPDDSDTDLYRKGSPLPDFLPPNLFSDLNLPEVSLRFQAPTIKEESMGVAQAINEFTVGNVTRRFVPETSGISHWIAPPQVTNGDQSMHIHSICQASEFLGSFQVSLNNAVQNLHCYRPWVIGPGVSPSNISPSSKGTPDWHSQLFPQGVSQSFDPPVNSPWASFIRSVDFFTHNGDGHVTARRFSLGSRANLLIRGRQVLEVSTHVRFVDSELPAGSSVNTPEITANASQAAIGFTQDVDGMRVRISIPSDLHVDPDREASTEKLRCLRTAYFIHRVTTDTVIGAFANHFLSEWLAQVYLSALTAKALETKRSLADAQQLLSTASIAAEMARVLDVIFQTLTVEIENADGSQNPEGGADDEGSRNDPPTRRLQQKMHRRLLDLCSNSSVTGRLSELAPTLWGPPDLGWLPWATEKFHSTVGAAILDACQRLCPQFDSDSLVLDIDPGPRPPGFDDPPRGELEIWITENTPGGAGVLEEVLRRLAEDPRRFFHLAEAALSPSEYETVDTELTRLLGSIQTDEELQNAVGLFRQASGNNQISAAMVSLRRLLRVRGFRVSHSVMTAISARILRPGSDSSTDQLLHRLISEWRASEVNLGIEVDARVFAFVASRESRFDDVLLHLHPEIRDDPQWRFQVIYSLLWPRGNVVRRLSLSARNPFAVLPPADRELVTDCLHTSRIALSVLQDDWHERLSTAMEEYGVVQLTAPANLRHLLKRAILLALREPLRMGFLHVYPTVDRIEWRDGLLEVALTCREALQ